MEWQIKSLKVEQHKKLENVVCYAEWTATHTEGTANASVSGVCCFAPPDETFIKFEDLKKDVVVSWCWNAGVNKDEIEVFLQNNILSQNTPTTQQVNVPWF